ncbi:MAG: RNA-directed DNA polymerase [Clostridia bacterium]|nr:RNA-directed DNA polymerase [Clostridia bacterium]
MITITYKELSSLTNDLGFSARALYALSNHSTKHYHKTVIPKHSGGERVLHVPDEFLKAVQRSIVRNLLAYEAVSPHARAYCYGASTVKNALPHKGHRVLLKLDIQNFFDSINYPLVKNKVFTKERFSESNRVLLSLLCTYKDTLPQGAPTSPFVSNIIMKDFDNTVGTWCNERNITYTRYCDDLTFSGDFNQDEVKTFVSQELRKMGFFLNAKKTTLLHDGQQKCVTGIVVNDKLNAPLRYRKGIRQEVYYCKKFGIEEHIKKQGIEKTREGYLKSLLGRINYVLSIDDTNEEMKSYKAWALKECKTAQLKK